MRSRNKELKFSSLFGCKLIIKGMQRPWEMEMSNLLPVVHCSASALLPLSSHLTTAIQNGKPVFGLLTGKVIGNSTDLNENESMKNIFIYESFQIDCSVVDLSLAVNVENLKKSREMIGKTVTKQTRNIFNLIF